MSLHPDIERQLPAALRRLRTLADAGLVPVDVADVVIAAAVPPAARKAARDRWLHAAHELSGQTVYAAARTIAGLVRRLKGNQAEIQRTAAVGTAMARAVAEAIRADPGAPSTPRHIERILAGHN